MVTITSHFFINIFQTVHFPAVKFTRGNEKNMSFLLKQGFVGRASYLLLQSSIIYMILLPPTLSTIHTVFSLLLCFPPSLPLHTLPFSCSHPLCLVLLPPLPIICLLQAINTLHSLPVSFSLSYLTQEFSLSQTSMLSCAVPSKNAVSANIKHSRYFHWTSYFWSIHYYGKSCMYVCVMWKILPLVMEEHWSSANFFKNLSR